MTTAVQTEHPDWCVIRRSDGRHCDVGIYGDGEHVGNRTLVEIDDGVLEVAIVQFQDQPAETEPATQVRVEILESPFKGEDPVWLHLDKDQAIALAFALIRGATATEE